MSDAKPKTNETLQIERMVVRNKRDYDICVTDCYGERHILFPMTEKELVMLKEKGKSNG